MSNTKNAVQSILAEIIKQGEIRKDEDWSLIKLRRLSGKELKVIDYNLEDTADYGDMHSMSSRPEVQFLFVKFEVEGVVYRAHYKRTLLSLLRLDKQDETTLGFTI